MTAGGGQLDDVAPAILRIPAADQVASGFELVQQQYDPVGVHEHRGLELLLGDARMVADEPEGDVRLHPHAEELLG